MPEENSLVSYNIGRGGGVGNGSEGRGGGGSDWLTVTSNGTEDERFVAPAIHGPGHVVANRFNYHRGTRTGGAPTGRMPLLEAHKNEYRPTLDLGRGGSAAGNGGGGCRPPGRSFSGAGRFPVAVNMDNYERNRTQELLPSQNQQGTQKRHTFWSNVGRESNGPCPDIEMNEFHTSTVAVSGSPQVPAPTFAAPTRCSSYNHSAVIRAGTAHHVVSDNLTAPAPAATIVSSIVASLTGTASLPTASQDDTSVAATRGGSNWSVLATTTDNGDVNGTTRATVNESESSNNNNGLINHRTDSNALSVTHFNADPNSPLPHANSLLAQGTPAGNNRPLLAIYPEDNDQASRAGFVVDRSPRRQRRMEQNSRLNYHSRANYDTHDDYGTYMQQDPRTINWSDVALRRVNSQREKIAKVKSHTRWPNTWGSIDAIVDGAPQSPSPEPEPADTRPATAGASAGHSEGGSNGSVLRRLRSRTESFSTPAALVRRERVFVILFLLGLCLYFPTLFALFLKPEIIISSVTRGQLASWSPWQRKSLIVLATLQSLVIAGIIGSIIGYYKGQGKA